MEYRFQYCSGHVEVLDCSGHFLFSADTMDEAKREASNLELLEAENCDKTYYY